MALTGLKTQTEFLPSIRFNAREGVFSRVDRSLDAEGKWANELVNINDPLAIEGVLMDITNIQLGWLRFEGQVDIQTQHHSLGPISQPSDLHKDGIKLEVWLPKSTSEGSPLREFSHTAAGVKNAINELHTAWERGADNVDAMEREAGEIVPLVKVVIDSFKTKNGTFKKPIFEIVGWFPRPVEWSIPVPVAVAPAAPVMAEAAVGGSFVEAPASPAGDDDLPF
jgi:hypothetical protein